MKVKVDLLDHGYVEFVEAWGTGKHCALSSNYGYADYEAGIIEAARQSTQGSFRGWDKDIKLLTYLMEHKHNSPFEFAGMTIEVQAPIFVFREWHRHRTQCLAGDSRLVFDTPRGVRAHGVRIRDLVRRWNATPPKRQRQVRTLSEFERDRISAMRLRSPSGHVSIADAWPSGEKRVYRLSTKYGTVTASSDHAFKTPDGWAKLGDSPLSVMAIVQTGKPVVPKMSVFTRNELRNERWVEIYDGYQVSDLGRVRSYWTTRGKCSEPKLKSLIFNNCGRVVVGIKGKTPQVSHLVWRAFVGAFGHHVLHRDGNSGNNRLINLYDGTDEDNSADRVKHDAQTRLREVPVDVLSIKRAGRAETFDITVTGDHAFVANNLVVHNSYNEMSARYTPLPDLYYMPTVERILLTSTTNKQASKGNTDAELDASGADLWRQKLELQYAWCESLYQDGLRYGVPKELARVIMPVGHYTRMRATANLRNWLAFLTLRMDPNAQWEIRQYANAIGNKIISKVFPNTWSLFEAPEG